MIFKRVYLGAACVLLASMVFLMGCGEVPAKTGKEIIEFSIYGKDETEFKTEGVLGRGVISEVESKVTIKLPAGTNLAELKPLIKVSEGASVSPKNKELASFEEVVSYVVTSEDGNSRAYEIIAYTPSPVTLVDIGIKAWPYKTEYVEEEELVLDGILVDQYWSDGTATEYDVKAADVSGYDPKTIGKQHVFVTIGGIKKFFDVTVKAKPALDYIGIDTYNVKKTYSKGEDLDLGGLVITEYYNDGTKKIIEVAATPVTPPVEPGEEGDEAEEEGSEETETPEPAEPAEYTVSGYDKEKLGNQKVVISVEDKTAWFEVYVNDTSDFVLTIGNVEGGNDELVVYGIPDGGIVLHRDYNNGPDRIVISVGADSGYVYSQINWEIDGYNVASYSYNTITIHAKDYAYTVPHNITIIATKNGVKYSKRLTFTVER